MKTARPSQIDARVDRVPVSDWNGEKLLKSVNKNQIYCKNKSGLVLWVH